MNICILGGVRSLKQHYESESPEEMTAKIKSITAFQNIKATMQLKERGFSSRNDKS